MGIINDDELEFPSYMSDRVEEEYNRQKEHYTCPACDREINTPEGAEIFVNLDGVPVCSHSCQSLSNGPIIAKRHLREAERRYAELDLQEEAHKAYYRERAAALKTLIELAGVGHSFQGPTGIVYETAEKRGTWVDFTPYEMKHTKRPWDEKGTLSLDRAEELGFQVERKRAKPNRTGKGTD